MCMIIEHENDSNLLTKGEGVFQLLGLEAEQVRMVGGARCPRMVSTPFQLPRVIIYESVQLVLFVIADTRQSRVNT